MTIQTELIDGSIMLVKSTIPPDTPSVCVEDFCGYSHPGHFPTSFWADYYPTLGFTRFGGDYWNIPDLYTVTEPTEETINAWERLHAFGLAPVALDGTVTRSDSTVTI